MKSIPQAEFETLIRDARVLEQDRRGAKVYETPDGRIVKLFRIKRRLSSNLWSPFAPRFATNAKKLAALNLASLTVTDVGWVPHIERQMVVYTKLAGIPLRHFLRTATPDQARACMRNVGSFVAEVHERGVFFRSFHFGNILVQPDDRFALIDILDLWIKRFPLGLWRRRRNLRHLSRYDEDRRALREHWESFCEGYQEVSSRGHLRTKADTLALLLDEHRQHLAAVSPA